MLNRAPSWTEEPLRHTCSDRPGFASRKGNDCLPGCQSAESSGSEPMPEVVGGRLVMRVIPSSARAGALSRRRAS